MLRSVEIHETDHLETLSICNGYYNCPKDADGNRLAPLVGYVGTYHDSEGKEKAYVGDKYFNFAESDKYPKVLKHFAKSMFRQNSLSHFGDTQCFVGMPIGGCAFSLMLGLVWDFPVIQAEKRVTALATATSRETSDLVFRRYSVEKNAKYAIVEDVCNNFSTTEKIIKLITSYGGDVVMIVCILNRSGHNAYQSSLLGYPLPVLSLVRKVAEEYRQDDPQVAYDVAKGNVIWKPKDHWHFFINQMALYGRKTS